MPPKALELRLRAGGSPRSLSEEQVEAPRWRRRAGQEAHTGVEGPRCPVTGSSPPPERLRPAGAFLLLRRHLLAEPGVHRLLRARDQGPLAGADRVLLPDREAVLPAVGQRPAGGPHPGGQALGTPSPGESSLPPAGDSTASSTDPRGAPPGTRQPAAPAMAAHTSARTRRQRRQPCAAGEHTAREALPRTGALRPHWATSG